MTETAGERAARERDLLFKEWEKAQDRAANFDDLLMRIRVFALPFIATAIGAGSFFGEERPDEIHAPWEVLCALSAATALVLLCIFAAVVWQAASTQLEVDRLEEGVWGLIMLSFVAWAVLLARNQPESFSFSAPVLTFGGLLLLAIYFLDRFYYSSLLEGAVERAMDLERRLGLELTTVIDRRIPDWTYPLLPAGLYLLPVFALINIGLAVMTFGGTEPNQANLPMS